MVFLPLILDALCLIHVIRSGRDRIWVYLILFVPLIGAAAYVAVEIVPEFFRSHHGRRLTGTAAKAIDPGKHLRLAAQALDLTDTVENRLRLAEASMALRRYEDAARLYAEAATGLHAEDTALLMGLARASFALSHFEAALAALDRLQVAHPGFQSHEAHLIYAASLEGLGRNEEARQEYEGLIAYHPGEEARCRYAQLLARMGETEKARILYEEILQRARRANTRYRKAQAKWIDIAKRNSYTLDRN